MKAIAYIRFSTDEQANGSSIERQRENIEAYARRNEMDIVEILIDDGFSASKGEHLSHGKLGRFLAEADKGKYKGLAFLVERQDRLSRLGIDQTHVLLRRLLAAGIVTHMTEEKMIIESLDDLMTVIMSVFSSHAAQQYSKTLSERLTKAWKIKKDAAAASHTPYGNSLPVWLTTEGQVKEGKRIVDYGKIVEVPEKVAVVQEIFRLAAQGIGSKNIVYRLNEKVLSRSWVIRTLKSRAVLGEFRPKGCDVIQGYYPQIVTQSEFDAARAQIKTKIRHGKYTGGNRKNSHLASNLFEYLLFDITTEPMRTMQFQTSRDLHYVMSAFDKGGRPSNRIRYDKLEKALLGFLTTADWQAIAGESESDEYKAAMAALEAKLRLRDAISREITSNTEAMVGEDLDTRKYFMRRIAKDEATLTSLTADIEALQASVEAAQAKSAGLAETKTFLELLNQLNHNRALRLPARAAIAKKVARIELVFMPERQGVVAFLEYTNGAPDATVILNKDIDENAPWAPTMPAALRTTGHFRIQRIRNKPLEYHEALKADVLKWVRSYAPLEAVA